MKKYIAFFLALSLLFCTSSVAFAEKHSTLDKKIYTEKIDRYDSNGEVIGSDIYITNLTLLPGGIFFLSYDEEEEITRLAEPEMRVTKRFIHVYHSQNGEVMATQTVTIVGYYSNINNVAEITSISSSFTGALAYNFESASLWSGNTGDVYTFFKGECAYIHTYTLSTTGHITQS